jgi:hypothetical protein
MLYVNQLGASNDNFPYDLEKKLGNFIRKNSEFSKLNEDGKKALSSLPKRYSASLRSGRGISEYSLKKDLSKLKSFDINKRDINKIKGILDEFKS